ncbi:acyl-CoA thioesterase [Polymorphobacter fuscus]|uniref:Acyl-CoA thioesterase n=1 Tax=Sandarakinorhabdus fusca TaxID=1439888 RepID=A0A7C9KMA7_9SPHN|nr:acyl-CoA thioesterase [Polymorphobacter fuscus]KAB7646461.1 acyl-CoA thioesterase [Polymorphobacter fuscus]MQT17703.1 acyl-CoA thioesterase [Polymorphobacter fuscus]NJC09750.1 acyl-CoA thioester hydrolase [Polymorphobacter fuscus]
MPPPADRTAHFGTVTATAADIDALGHVNNAVYLRWVQDIATGHWQAVARPADIARYIWVVTRHEIDYLGPTLAGETVTLATWVGTPRGARFDRLVEITGADGRLRVRALTIWALIDQASGRAVRVPPEVAAPFLQ